MTLQISERLRESLEPDTTLTLPFELRQKSRLLTRLDNGETVALFLPRGSILRQDDLLKTTTGLVVRINAALEVVSTATTGEPLRLARACYHLGNRHVLLQIGVNWLRYLHDPVLDNLVRELGLVVIKEHAPLEPETGAYGGGHPHGH